MMHMPEKEVSMFAAVDLGSNSFRLHVGKHDGDTIRVLKSMREPIRLAAGLDARQSDRGRDGVGAGLPEEFRRRPGLGYKLDAVRVVATSTMRVA
ncbi:hypothetical protein LP420_03745 [Massilia sp. B-10]|nr:hypothetical protein LP420_03745 [Massilia sp. B-10]